MDQLLKDFYEEDPAYKHLNSEDQITTFAKYAASRNINAKLTVTKAKASKALNIIHAIVCLSTSVAALYFKRFEALFPMAAWNFYYASKKELAGYKIESPQPHTDG
jgi:hypothetical protein